jgi:hypothetical protein
MNKIICFIGGLLGLVGIILPFADKTMAWWTVSVDPNIGDTVIFYLMPLGDIINNSNDDVIDIEGNVLLIITFLVVIGSLLILIGTFMDNKNVAFIGTLLLIGGIAYFLQAIGNIEEIQDLMRAVEPDNYLFGEETVKVFILEWKYKWALGTGFYISTAGAIVSLIGLFQKQ